MPFCCRWLVTLDIQTEALTWPPVRVGPVVAARAAAVILCSASLGQMGAAQTLTATRGSFTPSAAAVAHIDSVYHTSQARYPCDGAPANGGPKIDSKAPEISQPKLKKHPTKADIDNRAVDSASAIGAATPAFNCKERSDDSVSVLRRQIIKLLSDSLTVAVIADASLRPVLTNGPSGNTPVSGSIGVAVGEFQHNLTVLVNVAGLTDTLRRNVGAAMLPPTAGGLTSGTVSALVDYRQMIRFNGAGFHIYGSVSPAILIDSTTGRQANAVIAALGAQASWEVYNQTVSGTAVSTVFDLGPSLRTLVGDIANSANDGLRDSLLATKTKQFVGVEAGMTLFVKDVRVGVSTYYFGGNVAGLSHVQAVFGVSVYDAVIDARSRRAGALGLF